MGKVFDITQDAKLKKVVEDFYNNYAKDSYNSCNSIDDWVDLSIHNAIITITSRTLTAKIQYEETQEESDDSKLGQIASEISNKNEENGLTAKIREWLICTSNEIDFDTWHHNACKDIVLPVLKKHYNFVNYGKAQKIVNITFKYMYCSMWQSEDVQKVIGNKEIYENKFEHCHMPLDSFTLEWFNRRKIKIANGKKNSCLMIKSIQPKRNRQNLFVLGKVPSWSNLQYSEDGENYVPDNKKGWVYTYNFFVNEIRELFKSPAEFTLDNGKSKTDCYNTTNGYFTDNETDNEYEKYTPLQAEFIIWEKIKRELVVEDFITTFDKSIKKVDLLSIFLNQKIEMVKSYCDNYTD